MTKKTSGEVLASTAGIDNWKTWAGRSHGSEDFEYLDLFRGVRRSFKQKFIWGLPVAGAPCPVCMVAPESKAEWHVTSACGHACCLDCLRGYASSLIRDPEHHGPLKCPVCPQHLRPKDAVKAIGNDQELIAQWDDKIRDQMLRALPNYRHCPHCNQQKKEGDERVEPTSNALEGGGFVTPECLAPVNKQREKAALNWLDNPFVTEGAFKVLYALYVCLYAANLNDSSSIFVDIINTSVFPGWLLRRMWLLARKLIAFEARRALFKPIKVECPCCDKAFILNTESELGHTVMADKATQAWIGTNARPCPSCSVPISKIDGCNHMRCSHCRARFCWACMHVRSSCAAFGCKNGAPYGNANGLDPRGNGAAQNDDAGILNRIDRMNNEATDFTYGDLVILATFFLSILARENPLFQFLAEVLVTSFAFVFSGGTLLLLLMSYVIYTMVRDIFQRIQRHHRIHRPRGEGMVMPNGVDQDRMNRIDETFRRIQEGARLHPVRDIVRINQLEERMVNEAISRSLVEQ